VELAEEFLKNANECLRLAQEAHTLEGQIHWLSMAQFWQNLARQASEEDAVSGADPSILPTGKPNGDENGNGDSESGHQ
jgi:hypothetical protein